MSSPLKIVAFVMLLGGTATDSWIVPSVVFVTSVSVAVVSTRVATAPSYIKRVSREMALWAGVK